MNRLAGHPSPYLEQHAENPVEWWPWSEEAFEEARKRDVPVFLSIGYATCHWCHVMAHESFEDEAVAALMNEHFVCIKVDREERPDIDETYMAICQATSGRGGWPLTAILDHEKRAWFTGTYFPKHGRGHHIGMMDLVPRLSEAWHEKREELEKSAAHVLDHLQTKTERGELPADMAQQAARGLLQRFDPEHGGFGNAPKFPSPHNLTLLLAEHTRTGDATSLEAATTTLDAMAAGGVHDHVGGGFHRYSTDRNWLLPHFEKMLYDQATQLDAYTQAWQVTKNSRYAEVAEGIVDYVLRDLRHAKGAFFSAEDADSEGEEGTFYIWKFQELVDLIGEDAARTLGAKPEGNFVDESTRKPVPANIIHVARGGAIPADAQGTLLDVRAKRIRPLRDEKILTDWNGLWIDALSRAAMTFAKPDWLAAATHAAQFILDNMNDGRLRHRWRDGVVDEQAFLDDYAHFGNALVSLFEATGDAVWLRQAKSMAQAMMDHQHEGAFTTAPADGFRLVTRVDAYDGAAPSGNSGAARLLARLAAFTDGSHEETARGILSHFASQVSAQPSAFCSLLQSLHLLDGPQIVVTDEAMSKHAWQTHLPGAIRHHHRHETGVAWLDAHESGGYICQNRACQSPCRDLASFKSSLAALWPTA